MKKVIGIIAGLVVVVGGFFLLSSPAPVSNESASASEQLSMAKITTDIANGAVLYDVRTPEEFAEGYIDGATLFPLTDMQAGSLPEVAKDTTVYVYCRSGNRSAQAVKILENAGFSSVVDLGGYQDVVKLGGTLVQ